MDPFDPSKLSSREREILDLAVNGLTDQQIAQRLEISPSTVNSYWVRIRGKVGFFSRTELAGKALRLAAQTEHERLMKESENYRLLAERNDLNEADVRNAEVHRAALQALPEAVVVVADDTLILFTNRLLDELFGYEEGELLGKSIEELVLPAERSQHRELVADYFKNPEPMRIGIDRVVYGRRKDGSRFRVMLLIGAAATSQDKVAACIVRSFLGEIDTLRRRAASMMS